MKRLDEIKVRLNNAETVTDEGVLLDSVIVSHAAADVAVLVAAIEAVLELGREGNAYRNAWEKGYDYAIEEAHDAIRQALGEGEQ